MAYTETREINGRKYYYRVKSIRKGNKISKKRFYLGSELLKEELIKKEKEADKKLLENKTDNEIRRISKAIKGILKKNKINKAGIFGSFSRSEQKKGSDIDILIQIDPDYSKKISLLDIIRLEKYLEKKLGRKVDLVEYSSLHHLLKDKILKEEIRIL